MHYKSPVFLIRTHSVFVPPFRWCISGYQCKWRKAQALVWLPQKQGQKNWTLAHVDQWITWFIKWLNTHNPSSNLFAGCTRTPASSPSSPPRSSSLGRLLWVALVLPASTWDASLWEYTVFPLHRAEFKTYTSHVCVQQHFHTYRKEVAPLLISCF